MASECIYGDMSKCTEEVATMSGGGSRRPGRVEEGWWPAQTKPHPFCAWGVYVSLQGRPVERTQQQSMGSSQCWHRIFPHFPSSHGGGSSMLLVACVIM